MSLAANKKSLVLKTRLLKKIKNLSTSIENIKIKKRAIKNNIDLIADLSYSKKYSEAIKRIDCYKSEIKDILNDLVDIINSDSFYAKEKKVIELIEKITENKNEFSKNIKNFNKELNYKISKSSKIIGMGL